VSKATRPEEIVVVMKGVFDPGFRLPLPLSRLQNQDPDLRRPILARGYLKLGGRWPRSLFSASKPPDQQPLPAAMRLPVLNPTLLGVSRMFATRSPVCVANPPLLLDAGASGVSVLLVTSDRTNHPCIR
jgi:hypothetical protein